jgi:CRP-like cAMP-binding protein
VPDYTPISSSDNDRRSQRRPKIDKARVKEKVELMQGHELTGQAPVMRTRAPSNGNGTAISQRAAQVQQFPLFLNISPADCREIVSTAHEKVFSRRQTIFFQGDPARQILLLTSGCVKITQLGQNGTEVILRLIGPGELVRTAGLFLRCNHGSTARALRPSTALVWEAAVFEAFAERFPILRHNAARILGQHFRELEERFREISTERVARRLGREIARLLNQVGQRVNGAVRISLSREELAQLTGTTLFTVCRLLSQWEQQGIVTTGRETVMVRNLQALEALSEGD